MMLASYVGIIIQRDISIPIKLFDFFVSLKLGVMVNRCVGNRWEGMIVGVHGPGENSDNFLVVSGPCVFHAWPNKQSKQTNL